MANNTRITFPGMIRLPKAGVLLLLLTIGLTMSAKAIPYPISFLNGATQSFSICQNASAFDITSMLHVNDQASGRTITWTISAATNNGGILNGFGVANTASSGTTNITPGNTVTYQPANSFSGPETFTIQATDGTQTVTTQVSVTVNALPTATFTTNPNPGCLGSPVTFTGAPGPPTNCGVNALQFTGAGSMATRGVITTAQNNITMEAWVNWNGGNNSYEEIVNNGNTGANGYGLRAQGGQVMVILGFVTQMYSSYILTPGVWTHLAVTCNGSNVWTLYVNGVPTAMNENTATAKTPSGSFTIGNDAYFSYQYFRGKIDEVKFWTTARTQSQIFADMNACSAAPTTGLLGYWSLNEGTGSTAADGSGNSNTLTVSSASWVTSTWSPIPSYTWSFGDGGTSQVNGVKYVYPSAGTFTPTLTVTGKYGCTASTTSSIVINTPPVISAISSDGIACAGTTLHLLSTAGGGAGTLTYAWTGPNTFTSSLEDPTVPSVTEAAEGWYTLTVTDENNCSDAESTPVVINPLPEPGAITGATPVCPGDSIALANTTADGPFAVGQSYGGGIIAYILQPGDRNYNPNMRKGIIAAPTDQSTGIQWNNGGSNNVYVFDTAAGAGYQNTSDIVSYLGTGNYAASISRNLTLGGYSNWSLPTVGELKRMYANKDIIGGFSANLYWASNEYNMNPSLALTVSFDPMSPPVDFYTATKSELHYVRAVRQFAVPLTSIATTAWESGDPSIATVSSTGVVSAVSSGTVAINYLVTNSCGTTTATTTVQVLPKPLISAIGYTPACKAKQMSLSSTITGGTAGYSYTWSGPNSFTSTLEDPTVSSAVTMGDEGVYQLIVADANHCVDTNTTTVVVYPIEPIVGSDTVTFGLTNTLSDPITGGTWSTPTPWVTKVTAGDVKGISAGVSQISYTTIHGCVATYTVTVISGINACVGQTIVISDGLAAGGTWTSGSASIATVTNAGVVTGVSAGNVVITHKLSATVMTTTTVKVNPLAATTSANTSVCLGQTLAMANGTAGGGTWYSSNTSTAVISSGGVVSGITSGSAVVYFTPLSGCITTKTITVSAVAPLTGPTSVCVGQTITLTNAISGGTWSTSNGSQATVATGIVNGVSAGTPTISYKWSNGCYATSAITVKALSPITGGATSICQGTTMTLANATPGGGTWSSDAKFSVNGSGVATGISSGTGNIYFNGNNGCTTNKQASVTAGPVLGGTLSVCVGQTTLLSSSMTGGTWSTSNGSQATVYNGIVGGVTAGTPIVSYKMPTGCNGFATVTVNALSPIAGGSTSICPSGTTAYTNATSGGGVWSSSVPAVANINGSGLVTGAGAAAGSKTVISFTSTANACIATRTVTIVACRDAGTTETTVITPGTFDVRLYPNPNNGSFSLKGTVDIANGEETNVEVVNMLGQMVYRGKINVQNGNVDDNIQLRDDLAPGIYVLNMHSTSAIKQFHFIISK